MRSSTRKSLFGVLPVLHTPFHDDGSIDRKSLQKEIDWAFEVGADGVVTAMVSEVLRLGYHARKELTELVVEMTAGRGSVTISVGSESIREAVEFTRHAEESGADGVMAIPPVSIRLGRSGTTTYFDQIASSTDLPLIVQDASGYVGAAIDLNVYLDLLKKHGIQRILFKPEASPLGPNLSILRDATAGEALIFEGSGGINLVDCYRRGIHGTMPGTDLLDGIVALWKALKSNDDDQIYALSFPITALVTLQLSAGLDGFLAIEKYLMWKRGIFPNRLQRQPAAWELDEETRQEVDRLFERVQSALVASRR